MTEQTFTRGGFPLHSDPSMGRTFHGADQDVRCTVCGGTIFGDEEYLPNKCPLAETPLGPHTYPNGEKCPDLLYVPVDVPDGHYLFRATDLARPDGFDCDGTNVPDEVGDMTADDWALNVVDTVVVNLLLPLLPFEYTLREDNGHGNPVRLATINGRDITTIGAYERNDLLSPHYITLPVTVLAALATNYPALADHGIDEHTMIATCLAGMTPDEAGTAHAAGTLHQETLHVVAALRA